MNPLPQNRPIHFYIYAFLSGILSQFIALPVLKTREKSELHKIAFLS